MRRVARAVRIPIPVCPEPQRNPVNTARQDSTMQRASLVASESFRTHFPHFFHIVTSYIPLFQAPQTLSSDCPYNTATVPFLLATRFDFLPLALTSSSYPQRFGLHPLIYISPMHTHSRSSQFRPKFTDKSVPSVSLLVSPLISLPLSDRPFPLRTRIISCRYCTERSSFPTPLRNCSGGLKI
jgi:hypothetical protein